MSQMISITGTESTGKTELAGKLASHYKTVFVPDYSRKYIAELKRAYNADDVLKIAEGIIESEKRLSEKAEGFFFSDNDLVNIKIWLQYYKWQVPDWLEQEIVNRKDNLHLLCDIDIEWTPDEQRENRDDRQELFLKFKDELSLLGANFKIIRGRGDERAQQAIEAVDEFLSSLK